MYKQILIENQLHLLPLLKKFSNDFCLVGGTAIALQICHRRSIDFDLFTDKAFKRNKIINFIKDNYKIEKILYEDVDELTMIINSVKVTFFQYPFIISPSLKFEEIIQIPSIAGKIAH